MIILLALSTVQRDTYIYHLSIRKSVLMLVRSETGAGGLHNEKARETEHTETGEKKRQEAKDTVRAQFGHDNKNEILDE